MGGEERSRSLQILLFELLEARGCSLPWIPRFYQILHVFQVSKPRTPPSPLSFRYPPTPSTLSYVGPSSSALDHP